ncbi:polysaccharide deacetylase family protein [Bacillus marasmi]|uniref:polysaccharide deacetylase family protein n=1 Tax=Bacillus marasmi TaxID=1926279 RepID=UPI0011C845A3|nr:polysaccharide deacetylase family protein [Bacillus marasmi]
MFLNNKQNITMIPLFIFVLWLVYMNSLRFYENSNWTIPNEIFEFSRTTRAVATVALTELPEKQTGLKPLDTVYTIKTAAGIVSDTGQNTVNSQLNSSNQTGNLSNSGHAGALPAKKTVYLTFDDGPKPFSPEILSILSQYGAKATFFMIDGNIRSYPDAARQMVASGHTVASHGVSHRTDIFYQSSQTVISEMEQTRNTIKEVTGTDSILIRTPYGSAPYMTDEYKQAVVTQGLQMWDWNIDSKDWYYRDQRLVDTVISQIEARMNSTAPIVILLHEQQETLAQLPALLQYLTSQQFDLQPINPSIPPVQF